jgi:hypothetical protein
MASSRCDVNAVAVVTPGVVIRTVAVRIVAASHFQRHRRGRLVVAVRLVAVTFGTELGRLKQRSVKHMRMRVNVKRVVVGVRVGLRGVVLTVHV